jgi:hypothetical protein
MAYPLCSPPGFGRSLNLKPSLGEPAARAGLPTRIVDDGTDNTAVQGSDHQTLTLQL